MMPFEKIAIQKNEARESHAVMEEWIRELERSSRYEREKKTEIEESIRSPEGEEYTVRSVEDSNDPVVEKIHAFLTDAFGEDEVEPLSWVRHSIEHRLSFYDLVETKTGEVASLGSTQYLELENGDSPSPPESMLYVAFILSKPEFRGKGLATELYRAFYRRALQEAERRGQTLRAVVGEAETGQDRVRAVIGEAVSSVEPFLNRMGRKRIYFEDERGNVREIPYTCPPVDINKDGEALSPPCHEHLMVRLTNNAQELPTKDLIRMVRAIYKEYIASPANYNSAEAFARSENLVMGFLDELEDALRPAKDGKVFLLNAEERRTRQAELTAKGKEFFDLVIPEPEQDTL